MRPVVFLACMAVLPAIARAGWKDMKPGMDAQATWQCLGIPMLQTRGPAAQMWTYDNGGYVLFVYGRVNYWEPPKPPKVAPVLVTQVTPKPSSPAPAVLPKGRMVVVAVLDKP